MSKKTDFPLGKDEQRPAPLFPPALIQDNRSNSHQTPSPRLVVELWLDFFRNVRDAIAGARPKER